VQVLAHAVVATFAFALVLWDGWPTVMTWSISVYGFEAEAYLYVRLHNPKF
jgi:hypothetical protein